MNEINLEEILQSVEKPGRYSGGEWNAIRKDPQKVKAKIALVFPDLYEIGMSYLGQRILYYVLNKHPSFLAERVFAPWIDMERLLRAKKTPLFSLENKIPLSQFDILGFSLLYELNYSNILTILDLGHIPLLSSERGLDHPLVVAGGPAVFNPEPVADFFDLFLIGDGEEAFIEIIEELLNLKKKTEKKNDVLRELAGIKGVYVPSFYTLHKPARSFLSSAKPIGNIPSKIEKRILFPFDKAPFPEKVIVPNIKTVFDRVAVEVARGCPHKCRFCQASSIYFPSRVKDPGFVLGKVFKGLQSSGYEDVSLSSLSISDYPYLEEIVEALMGELEKERISLSLSSLRPKGLTSAVVKNIKKVRKTGFTLVPEAGTDRLRRVINKKLNDEDILKASKNAFSQGWKLLKLYFMVGLPTEKEEDIDGILNLVNEIIRIGYETLKFPPRIHLSVSSFIPKPHTPFQWIKMENEKGLIRKHGLIKSGLKKYPFVKFKKHSFKSSVLEAVFSRGDRRLNQVLIKAWKDGARFDGWSDLFNFNIWENAFKARKIDYHKYLFALDRNIDLPWDHIDTGLKKSFLLQELDKALKEEYTEPCQEKKCKECQGCSVAPYYKREYLRKPQFLPQDFLAFRKKTKEVFRYRANYSKLQNARFLSHMDMNNIIHRSFRRAGISVIHSKGFHPKMMFSYLPALSLGMEGKAEVLEFKANSLYFEKDFVSRINEFLPPGIRFLSLKRLGPNKLSLSKDIKAIVYSVKLMSQEIEKSIQTMRKERDIAVVEKSEIVRSLIDDFLEKSENKYIEKITLSKKKERVFIYLKYDPQKAQRPHEIVERIFRIKNPVFLMAREKVLFKVN
ncbi:TIGR03960 family B12-binding radical SAM protein [Acidobacteriota bacterium]